MSIRSMLVAAAFTSARLEAAADGRSPIAAMRIEVGEVSGVACYTVERGRGPCHRDRCAGHCGNVNPCFVCSCTGSECNFFNTEPRGRAPSRREQRQRAHPQASSNVTQRSKAPV
jgi:hypothetical protein